MQFEQFIQKINKPLSVAEQMELMGRDLLTDLGEIQKMGNIAIHPEILDIQSTEVLTRIQQQILMIIRGHRGFLGTLGGQSIGAQMSGIGENDHTEPVKQMEGLMVRVTEHMSLVTLIRVLKAVNKQLDLREKYK